MTDTSDSGQAGEQQGEIAAGLYVVSQNVELAQIPADAEDEPAAQEHESMVDQ
jgi:hypothetical protein